MSLHFLSICLVPLCPQAMDTGERVYLKEKLQNMELHHLVTPEREGVRLPPGPGGAVE